MQRSSLSDILSVVNAVATLSVAENDKEPRASFNTSGEVDMRHRTLWQYFKVVALALVLAPLSGCFLQVISGATFQQDGSLITTVETEAILATCVNGGFGSDNVECTYFFFDDNGIPVETSSSADLISEFGLLGVIIDPLVFQIPGNAVHISGTYETATGNMGNLVVRSGFKSVPADSRRTLLADPGTQFAIVELPNGVPFDGETFRFNLRFEQPEDSPTPVKVKPLLTIKYTGGNEEYYTPFLPCETSMANVPEFTIPMSNTLQPLALPVAPVSTCQNEQYLLVGFGGFGCDSDADFDVDRDDLRIQASARGGLALPGDRLDTNRDGIIDLYDTRRCARQCTRPRCATEPVTVNIP